MASTFITLPKGDSAAAGLLDGRVDVFASLPAAGSHIGEVYLVETSTGIIFINRQKAGFYYSNGTAWDYLTSFTAAQVPFDTAGTTLVGADVNTAIAELDDNFVDHAANPDPHPQYTTALEVAADVTSAISAAVINDLDDVNAPAPAVDDLLVWGGARWVNLPLEDLAMKQYKLLLDEVSATVIYVGEALPGSATSAALWRIKKIDDTATPDLSLTWADGVATFDKIWNDRLTYTYS